MARVTQRSLVSSALLAAVGCGVLAEKAFADGSIVFDQLSNTSGGGFFSDAVYGQYWLQRMADDFTLGAATSINGISWRGRSEYYAFPGLDNFESFRIQIFADAGGYVGASLMDITVAVGDANPTQYGSYYGSYMYDFDVKFDPIAVGAGTYWLSIGTTNVEAFGDGFVWHSSATGNNLVGAELGAAVGTGVFQNFAGFGDLAFAIQASDVPAPGALALLGMAGLVSKGRRRRATS